MDESLIHYTSTNEKLNSKYAIYIEDKSMEPMVEKILDAYPEDFTIDTYINDDTIIFKLTGLTNRALLREERNALIKRYYDCVEQIAAAIEIPMIKFKG